MDEISCIALTCADDMTFASEHKEDLQILVNEREDYSGMEYYLLHPVESGFDFPLEEKKKKKN